MTPDCFSKIISGKTKTPKKESIVALALALKLNYDEATDLLSSAGQTLVVLSRMLFLNSVSKPAHIL